jgi:uncharacterized membrane protein (DUF485 family)
MIIWVSLTSFLKKFLNGKLAGSASPMLVKLIAIRKIKATATDTAIFIKSFLRGRLVLS